MRTIIALLLLTSSAVHGSKHLQFNSQGNIIKPDYEQVRIGLKHSKNGKHKVALKRFKKAARFGNYYAITLIAAQYINQKDYVKALAWLQLIDLTKTPHQEVIAESISLLENHLSAEKVQAATQLNQDLMVQYGHEAAFKNRERWRNSLQFTGTNIRGKVPQNLKFTYSIGDGGADQHTFTIPAHQVEGQLNQFVYEYEFDFPAGEVTLGPIDLQD
jgi:hypothetical protein